MLFDSLGVGGGVQHKQQYERQFNTNGSSKRTEQNFNNTQNELHFRLRLWLSDGSTKYCFHRFESSFDAVYIHISPTATGMRVSHRDSGMGAISAHFCSKTSLSS